MKKLTRFNLVSALLLAALVVLFPLSLASCDDGSDSSPQIPSALWDTTWKHTDGDKVSFTKTTATVIPVSSGEQTFTLKDTSYVEQLNQTTMFFGSSQTADFINYRDGDIVSVSLGWVTKTYGWSRDIINPYAHEFYIDPQLVGKWERTTTGTYSTEIEIRDNGSGEKHVAFLNIANNAGTSLLSNGSYYGCYSQGNKLYLSVSSGSHTPYNLIYDYTVSGNDLILSNCSESNDFNQTVTKSSFTW